MSDPNAPLRSGTVAFMAASLVAYSLSFSLSAYAHGSCGIETVPGWAAFQRALSHPVTWLAWCANPVFWIGWCLPWCGLYGTAGLCGALGLGLGTIGILLGAIAGPEQHAAPREGFFLWIFSVGSLSLAPFLPRVGTETRPAYPVAPTGRPEQGDTHA